MADTTYQNISTTTQLPSWYQDYLQQVMGRAVGAAGEPYQPYTGPTNAALTPDQQSSFDLVRSLQGNQTGTLQNALDLYNGSASGNSGAAGAGAFGQATDLFNQGASADTGGMYSPYGQQATDFTYQAGQNAQPYLQASTSGLGYNSAQPYIQAATQQSGLSAAQPYLNAASGSFPQASAAYMSPYRSAVTDRIAELGARNLSENILPSISDDFVRAGQYGSTRQRDLVGRAARDTQDSILGQQAQALESGYSTAGQLYESDAARQAQLAGTAGGLGTQQQQTLLGAGQAIGGLGTQQQQLLQGAGTTFGNLGLGQASSISNIGATGAGLYGQDANRQIQAGQGLSSIGQSQIQAQQADYARQLQAAQGIQGLSGQAQNMGLQIAGALDASGQEQQGSTQASYNAALAAYNAQQQYPWQTIGNLSNVIQGLPINQSSTSSSSSTAPSPSVAGQVGGLVLGAAGLAHSNIFKAKGGAVRGLSSYAGGGRVRSSKVSYGIAPRRGISFAKAA